MGSSAATYLPDPGATDRLGRLLSSLLRPGDVLLLQGQIGAGKTHLARSIIRDRLGVPDAHVPSPTFTLVQTYDLPETTLWHVDLYRLADPSEAIELGLDDALGNDIVLVEWPERLDNFPSESLVINLEVQGDGRRATLSSESDRWMAVDALFKATHA